jgi:tetratricopeptide (TPR) repeat protein
VEKYRSAAGWGLFNALFHPDEKAASLEPAARYQEGEEALAEGRYEDALAAFEAAGDYRNAPERMLDTHYQEGEAALAEGRYEDALAAFEAAGDYKDATERRTECLAGAIEAYGEAGDLEKAEELLKDVPAGERERLAFSLAEKAVEQGEYRRAYEFFREAGSKPEDAEVWAECCAAAVREYAAEGDMEAAEIARKAYTLRGRNNKGTELNLVLAEGYIRAGDYGKAKSFLPGGVFQDADLEARRQEASYRIGVDLYEQGNYTMAESYLGFDYQDSERYYSLCLVGELGQKCDSGDYARAVSIARKVDESLLTKEEREAFHEALYSGAAKAKNKGEYASAFTLYQLSQTKDYQSQMDACNEKYISTPRSLVRLDGLSGTGTPIHHGLGNYGELTDVRCIYSKGQLTFTLYYTANRDLEWVLFRGPYNDNHFRSFTRGTVKKGSGSTSFTVSYSALRSYNETWIELYTNGGSGFDMVTLYSSDFEAWTLDLYGNPIP